MLEGISVCGLLNLKRTIWGYYIEVWAQDRVIVRTNMASYDETAGLWNFAGQWVIAGAVESKFDTTVLQDTVQGIQYSIRSASLLSWFWCSGWVNCLLVLAI